MNDFDDPPNLDEFPRCKYERGIFVKCTCGSIEELPLDEAQALRVTGRPKLIAEGTCSKCSRKISAFATLAINL